MKSAYISYIFALLLFGSNGIIASHIQLASTEIVFYRTSIGSLFLFLIFLSTKKHRTFHKHKKQFLFLILSGISMGLSWLFLYEAYQQIGVSISSLLYYCGPIIVIALAPIIFREKLHPRKLLGFSYVFIGIILVNGKLFATGNHYFGIFCGIMSAIMYSLMIIFNKKAKNISGLENSLLQLTISFITVACITLLRGDLSFQIPRDSILPLLFLGIVNTGLGCYLYFSKLEKIPVQSVSILGYLEPLSAVIMSVIFLRENMSSIQVIGALLVIGGAIYSERFSGNT